MINGTIRKIPLQSCFIFNKKTPTLLSQGFKEAKYILKQHHFAISQAVASTIPSEKYHLNLKAGFLAYASLYSCPFPVMYQWIQQFHQRLQ